MLGQRGIQPEKLAAEEDLQRLERRVKSEEKKLATQTKALPPREDKKDKP
jgi:DNA-damage-inducible protein D